MRSPIGSFSAHTWMRLRFNDIDHRLTKPKHPWTNGQVERMNRTIKDATIWDASLTKLTISCEPICATSSTPTTSPDASRLLRGLTPYEFLCKASTSQPERSTISPLQKMPGLNGSARALVGPPL